MKKGLRAMLSLILSAVLFISVLPTVYAEDNFAAAVTLSSVTDGSQLYCMAKIENCSPAEGFVSVVSAVFNSDGTEKSAKREKVEFLQDGKSVVNKEIVIDYSAKNGETAKIFFWKGDTLQPLCSPVISTEVPEGPIEEGKINITSDMVFASAEAEGDHRVTAAADSDAATYWSAKGVARGSEASVTVCLDNEHVVSTVGILFGMSSERQYVFNISTSRDGRSYTEVLGETTSELTGDVQYFDVERTVAKFMRVTVIERVEPDENNWVQIAELEAFGMLLPVDMGQEVEYYGFDAEGVSVAKKDGAEISGFTVQAMDERKMNYTQSMGEELYAAVDYMPEADGVEAGEAALHLYDRVGRETDAVNGAGGILAGREYEPAADRGKYNISFEMMIPSGDGLDSYWSGFSLTNDMVSGGGDLSRFAAIQVRFQDEGDGFVFKQLTSNYYNEGSLISFMSTKFKKDALIKVLLEVDAAARRVEMTVTDGENTETRPMYFSYNDAEQARITTWSQAEARWLVFNTGAGAKSDMYIDNITVNHFEEESIETEKVLGTVDFTEDNDGEFTFKNTSDDIKGANGAYTGSLGERLYAEICEAPEESTIEGNAVHFYDAVGRETDAVNGAGGVMGYIKLPVPENKLNTYRIDFTLYAPVADEYGGFSLSNGIDGSYGVQLRFKPSTMKNAAIDDWQFNQYWGNTFNGGDYETVVGSITPIKRGRPWKISIEVNMFAGKYTFTVDDGINSQTRTKTMPSKYESWEGKNLDTLSFNTGIGGAANLYAGDITVTDLGFKLDEDYSALNGLFRLVAVEGTGKMLHHQGNEISDFAEKQDPAYTRFVERTGLMDSDGVSFEVANRPGYFLTIVPGTDNVLQVQYMTNNVRFRANATFYKKSGGIDPKNYGKDTVSYASYRDTSRYLYNNSGSTRVWKRHERNHAVFYQRNEATDSRISDNFNGTSINTSKWVTQYPWGDSHNHYGLCRKSAIEVKDGIVTLKANRIDPNDWNIKDSKGQTGKDLSSYGFGGWKKWQAYVGVISSGYASNRIFWRQSYMEGSFKQPNCGQGYWTAFWLSGVNNWPPETDIFEYMSSLRGAHDWFTNMHWSGSAQGVWQTGNDVRRTYHRYALDWGYDYMDMYYDGWCFKRYTGDIVNYQNSQGGMTMIINTGVGGWEPKLPSEYGLGLSLEWFRSFQY